MMETNAVRRHPVMPGASGRVVRLWRREASNPVTGNAVRRAYNKRERVLERFIDRRESGRGRLERNFAAAGGFNRPRVGWERHTTQCVDPEKTRVSSRYMVCCVFSPPSPPSHGAVSVGCIWKTACFKNFEAI